MIHQNEPPGNKGVTLNGRAVTTEEAAEIRKALGIALSRQLTLKAGEVLTVPWGNPAKVHTLGTEFDVEFAFELPEGRPGLDGSGSIMAVDAVGVQFGQAPDVVNIGTPERARLRFYIPSGPKGERGDGVPANPVENYVIGFKNGVIQWVPQTGGTGGGTGGTGSTTIINNVYNVGALMEAYPWEAGGVVTPTDPVPSTQTVFDTTTFNAAMTAANAATSGTKRSAYADSIIASMGIAQTLTMKRDGVTILTADYANAMTKELGASDVYVVLSNLTTATLLVNGANPATGTWTMEILGGSGFTRSIKLPAALDFITAVGNGFNPGPITLVIPRSLDGL